MILGSLYLGLSTQLGISKTIETITKGFGDIMMEVGLLIAFGGLMGSILNEVGAIRRLVERLLSVFGFVASRISAKDITGWRSEKESRMALIFPRTNRGFCCLAAISSFGIVQTLDHRHRRVQFPDRCHLRRPALLKQDFRHYVCLQWNLLGKICELQHSYRA